MPSTQAVTTSWWQWQRARIGALPVGVASLREQLSIVLIQQRTA